MALGVSFASAELYVYMTIEGRKVTQRESQTHGCSNYQTQDENGSTDVVVTKWEYPIAPLAGESVAWDMNSTQSRDDCCSGGDVVVSFLLVPVLTTNSTNRRCLLCPLSPTWMLNLSKISPCKCGLPSPSRLATAMFKRCYC